MARRPSLVQVVTDLQSQGRVGGNVPMPADTGWAQAGRELAGDFKRIADDVGRMADQAAKREGEAEGRQAGLDPEFRTRADGTIRGEAFDRAGLDIAETRLKTALEAQIDGLEEKHAANPGALAKGIDGVVSGLLTGAPDELRPKLQQWAGHKRLVAMRTATREQVARTRAEAGAAQQLELTDGLRALEQMAFKVGGDESAAQVVGERLAALRSVYSRRGVDGKPLMDQRLAAKHFADAREIVTHSQIKGEFSRLESPEAKAAFLATLEESWQNGKGPAGLLDLRSYEGLRSDLVADLRRATTGRDAAQRAIANEIKKVHAAAEDGLPPNTDDLVRLRGATAALPDLAADLRRAEGVYRFVNEFRLQPDMERDRWIAQEESRLAEQGVRTQGFEQDRLDLARKLHATARTESKQAPLEWADKIGLIPGGVADVDASSPQALAASLPRVVAHAETVARRLDLETPVYLRQAARRRLTAMAAGGGRPLLEVVEGVLGAGPAATRILAELNEAGASTLAAIGGHVQEIGRRTAVVEDVANGVALSRTTDFKPIQLSNADQRLRANSVHKGSLAGFPEQEQALINAANYAYGVRVQGKTADPTVWEQAFRELLGERKVGSHTYGGVAEHRGRALVVPPDIRQDRFSDVIRAIDIADFEVAPVTRGQRTADLRTLRGARLEPVGAGRFRMNIGEADAPEYLKRPDGADFVLDLKALKPRLVTRVPDAYIDGADDPSPPRSRPPGMMRLGGPMGHIPDDGYEETRRPFDQEGRQPSPLGNDRAGAPDVGGRRTLIEQEVLDIVNSPKGPAFLREWRERIKEMNEDERPGGS